MVRVKLRSQIKIPGHLCGMHLTISKGGGDLQDLSELPTRFGDEDPAGVGTARLSSVRRRTGVRPCQKVKSLSHQKD